MKLKTLLALSALAVGVSASAQSITAPVYPTLPSPKTTTLDKTGNTAQYLYNTKAQAFLRGANDYMTRATLDDTLGYKFKVIPQDGTEYFALNDSVVKFSEYRNMFADGQTGIWVDNNSGANCLTWTIADNADGTFSIGNAAYEGTVLGAVIGDTPSSASAVSSCTSIGMYVNLATASDELCSTWAAVSEEDFNTFVAENTEAIKTKKSLYNAQKSLYDALVKATTDYPAADFSTVISVYNNAESTADALAEAQTNIAAIEKAYTEANLDNATLENPIEITSQIPACDMANITEVSSAISGLWSREFTGSGTVGTIRKNTWSSEGASDGTNVLTPFIENWNAKGTNLSDFICHIDTIDVKPGVYKITANVRIYNESGASSISGAYIFANQMKRGIVDPTKEVSTDISTGEEGYFTYNSMLGYYAPEATTYAIVGADGKLTFGIMTKDANYNWQASKDWKVYYLGTKDDAYKFAVEHTALKDELELSTTIMTQSIKDEIYTALETYENATTADAIQAALTTYLEKVSSPDVTANQEAWAAYRDLAVVCADLVADPAYEKVAEAYDLSDLVDKYKKDYKALALGTQDVIDATAKLKEQYIKTLNATPEGTDLTKLITNPKFSNGWTGWEHKGTGGNVAANSSASCAEAWNSANFDIHQDLSNAPAGLYEIQVQGFYRYLRGDNAWLEYYNADGSLKTEGVSDYIKNTPAMIYLNDCTNPMANVFDYQTVNGELYTASGAYTDPNGTYWYPNTMETAGQAFAQGAYTVSAYGLLENYGDFLRIGMKGNSNQGGDSWAIFTNFKLVFQKTNATVAKKVLNVALPRLVTDGKMITSDVKKAADEAVATGNAMLAENSTATGEEMVKAIAAIYKSISAVDASVLQMDTLATQLSKVNEQYNNYKEDAMCPQSAKDAAKAMIEKYTSGTDGFNYDEGKFYEASWVQSNITTEQAAADIVATAAIIEALDSVVIPVPCPGSDAEPFDLSRVIKNNSFEKGDLSSWSYASGTGDTGAKDNSNSTYNIANADGNYVFNTWSSAAPEGGFFLKHDAVTGLPAGYYELKCLVASDQGNAISVTVNEVANEVDTAAIDKTNGDEVTVYFKLEEGEDLNINVTSDTWFKADYFQLYYHGAVSDMDISQGIDAVNADAVSAEYYSVDGVKSSMLQKGINIVRYIGRDGKVTVKKFVQK